MKNPSNRYTTVTLTAGGGVDTRRWLEQVPASVHTFYPSDSSENTPFRAELTLN